VLLSFPSEPKLKADHAFGGYANSKPVRIRNFSRPRIWFTIDRAKLCVTDCHVSFLYSSLWYFMYLFCTQYRMNEHKQQYQIMYNHAQQLAAQLK
ncbi:hypothetical protein KPNIH4_22818, partial [Klebsiella pneumoniae subsp. pneumoniae KPNIH4]